MKIACPLVAIIGTVLLTGCGTVNYNPATNTDTTPPTVNLLIKRYGQPDLEVQQKPTGASPKLSGDFGSITPNKKFDFSVLATAKDAESGIKSIKLSVTRTVCYVNSNGTVSPAYSGTKVMKEANFTDPKNAPTDVSIGFTGIIDNTAGARQNPTEDNLLVWKNANAALNVGAGVGMYWTVETKNFAGATTYSDVIYILAGDTSCPIGP